MELTSINIFGLLITIPILLLAAFFWQVRKIPNKFKYEYRIVTQLSKTGTIQYVCQYGCPFWGYTYLLDDGKYMMHASLESAKKEIELRKAENKVVYINNSK